MFGSHLPKQWFLGLVRDIEQVHSWKVLSPSGAGCKFVPSKTGFTLVDCCEPSIYEVKLVPEDPRLTSSQITAYIQYMQNLAARVQAALPSGVRGFVWYAVTFAGTADRVIANTV